MAAVLTDVLSSPLWNRGCPSQGVHYSQEDCSSRGGFGRILPLIGVGVKQKWRNYAFDIPTM